MKRKHTRHSVIEAGVSCINAKSYHNVGVNEILREANIPKGSFYNFFKSKEDFGVAAIEHYTQLWQEEASKVLQNKRKSPINRLKEFCKQGIEHHKEGCEGCLVGKLANEVSNLSPTMCEALKDALDSWSQLIANCIAEAQAAGEISKAQKASALAEFMMDGWQGAIMRCQVEQNDKPLKLYIKILFNEVLSPPGKKKQ